MELKHYGKLGMKWGKRTATPSSSDHSSVSAIRKKKFKDMTNEEMQAAIKRMKLEKEYRNSSTFRKGGKKIKELSNEELEAGIEKNKLKTASVKLNPLSAFTKFKEIDKMTTEQVKTSLEKINLEKEYKEYVLSDLKAVGDFINTLLFKQ